MDITDSLQDLFLELYRVGFFWPDNLDQWTTVWTLNSD